MAAPVSNGSSPEGGPPAEQAGYLYHKQKPERRSRRTGAGHATPPRRAAHHNLGHKTLIANIRTFAVVAGCMFVLLILALYIAKKTWQIKQSQHARGGRPAPALPEISYPAPEPEEGTEAVTPRPSRRSELDTDAIRKAVFLAKRGKALELQGQFEEAIERYRDALNVWPYLTQVWAQLGRAYMRVGDYPRAQIALERAVENDPGNPETLNDLGVSYLYQNLVAKAEDFFDSAAEIDPQFADSYFNRALCHLARGDKDSAEEALLQYLRLEPGDPRALKEKAYLDAAKGNYKEAIDSLKQALAEAPEWPPLYFDAAAASALMGRIEDALKYLEKGEALTSPSAVYRVYQEPAFREIRLTELGKLFERDLADRARDLMAAAENAEPAGNEVTEPMSSVSSPP